MHNLVIQILSSGLVGNEVIEQLGELLAAYAALDRWGETGELSMTPQEFVRVGLRASGITRDVYRAWRAFSRTVEGTGGRTAAAAHEEHGLTSALSSATTRLKALRGGPWG